VRRRYKRLESSEDNPDDWEIVHPVDEESFGTSCGGGATIHYGAIVPADQLVSGAMIRDSFTMAEVLSINVPYLHIGGSCDYREHENEGNEENEEWEKWQRYEARVATAYAKDLLNHVPIGY
jgi:nucleoside phosphorylase